MDFLDAPILDISWLELVLASGLVLLAIGVSRVQGAGLERSLFVGAVRAVVQLALVGYVLVYIFALDRWYLVVLALVAMVVVAGKTATDRQEAPDRRLLALMTGSLLLGSGLTLAYVTAVVVRPDPWYNPRYLIPLFGMIVGNAMNAAALGAERLTGEMRARRGEIEAYLALGASPSRASRAAVQAALRAALIPTVNSLMVVGIVSLPGMMTGQILAGSSPLLAVRYQIVVMFMLAGAVALSAVLVTLWTGRRHFTAAGQLRVMAGVLLVGLLLPATVIDAGAQTSPRPEVMADPLTGDLQLDGRLDEDVWQTSDSIAGFTEIEPLQGDTPTGRTVVRVLVSGSALVFGILAEDPNPRGIVNFAKARDARLNSEDHIKLVLDTSLDGRSGFIFAVNPGGARYDALVANQGEGENSDWDAIWDAATARGDWGWSAEIHIPIRSLSFQSGLETWGFNIERRIQRLQETSRWASPSLDFTVGHVSRAGRLTGLPDFELGLGLSVRPSLTGGLDRPEPAASTDATGDASLDLTQRLGANVLASLTVNTDFAETEVDSRRTNLTRFRLFFPEKRTFFLEGADVFDFGLGLSGGFGGRDLLPFHSRRIGLLAAQEVPIRAGAKVNGRAGRTSLGALAVWAGEVSDLTPATTMGVVRVRQDVLDESSVGVIATFGDPEGLDGSWMAGADLTYATSRFRGSKNFLLGVWGLAMDREDLTSVQGAFGGKVDYPNDDWDVALTYKWIDEGFRPSLGFVPRPGVQIASLGINYRHRPDSRTFRTLFYELRPHLVLDLDGRWESWRVFTAPINWRFESGDRFEFNWQPHGERLLAGFEVADGVVIPPGSYRFDRYRLEGQFAAKRKLSGMVTWWFGEFYDGTLHEIEARSSWNPYPLVTLELNAERNIGDLPQGEFTVDLVGARVIGNLSPDLQISTFVQYDSDSESIGSNTRLRWTFHPLGDLFVVYNHNLSNEKLVDRRERWRFESNQLLLKLQYAFRF